MVRVERSFENKRVLSIDDKIVALYGWGNPNDGNGTHAPKGTLFVEEPTDATEAVLWIKRYTDNPKSWETWDSSFHVITVPIAPAATEIIDVVPIAEYSTVKWMVDIADGISKTQSYEQLARARGTDIDYSRFAILGEKILCTVFILSDGSNITFSMTNNEANAITVKCRRIGV